jgi:predicted ferric reductase
MKSERTIISTIVILFLCLGVPLYFIRSSIYFPMDLNSLLYMIGKYAGFSAFILFTLQYFWTARFHFLEGLVPYDRRVAIHRTLGFLGFMVLILHPVLILASYNMMGMSMYISGDIIYGFAALLLLLLIIASTFLGRIWRVKFESWKKIHYVTFIVLTLAFIHSMGIGSDLFGINRILWILLWSSHAALMLGKFASNIKTWNRTYKVQEVIIENSGNTTLKIDKPKRSWAAGQFGFLSLKRNNKWEGWHPFSITSNNREEYLSVTIKSLGDFSNTISETDVGDPVKLNPGFGGFTLDRHKDSKYTMMAGGVGVTPIYSILKDLKDKKPPPDIRLLYTVHHESEILFREELDKWFSEIPNWDITYIVTSQPDWPGVSGRLTPKKAQSLCENNLSGTFFLCGPAAMTKSIEKFLRENGVPKRCIVTEHFVFLP